MTDRYENIRKALEMGPTPGPWKVGDQNSHCGISIGSDDDLVATAYLRRITSRAKWGEEHFALPENQESVANATLIAACDPDTIRELLAERDAFAAEVERLAEALRQIAEWPDGGNRYGQENIKRFARYTIAALREWLDEGETR